ncbi:MAG: AAA family ATPase [Bryobacterales bacterium]|nr:AAA family ATPase [Bryobacterales bacterium]
MIDASELKRRVSLAEIVRERVGLKPGGAGRLVGLCPFHQEDTPSFTVFDDGGWKCFGCGAAGDVFDFLQKAEGIDFATARRRLAERIGHVEGNGNGTKPKATAVWLREKLAAEGWRVAAEYSYGDSLRRVRFEHVSDIDPQKQRPKKTFRWEHRDGGAWLAGDGGTKPGLFANDAFRAGDGDALGLEGEGKVLAAGELGIPAFSHRDLTTEAAAALAGRAIVLWPDADEAGSKHASKAAGLLAGVARSVRLIDPPADLPHAGDIIDALTLGYDAARIRALMAAARPWQPASETSDPTGGDLPRIARVEDLPRMHECGSAEIRFTVEPFLVGGGITLLTGDAGGGKSSLATHWAARAAFDGVPCLVLDRENPLAIVRDRFARLRIDDGPSLTVWGGWHVEEAPDPGAAVILEWVQRCTIKPLIVVDSFSAFLRDDENSVKPVREFFHRLRRLADVGCTILLLHHPGKSGSDYRGSSDIKAAIDAGYLLTNLGEGRLDVMRLKPFKSRVLADDVVMRYDDGRFTVDAAGPVRTITESLAALLREHPGVATSEFEELASSRGIARDRARRWLKDAVAAGKVRVERGEKNRQFHTFKEGEPDGLF